MFERLHTTDEVFSFKLGAALTMEHNTLTMLERLQEETQRDELRQLFRHHEGETRQQIRNIEEAFEALGEEPDDAPFPTFKALALESQANIKMADDRIVDEVILFGAAETEHHEIAVYEGLITLAEARGSSDVAELLRQNLEQEQHTLEEVNAANRRIAPELAAQAAR
jgi:ferritin-like metal-binding protein YciE